MTHFQPPEWPQHFLQSLCERYNKKRVLVLGADGFLGANLAIALHLIGARVTATTRRSKSRIESYADQIIYGDLSDTAVAKMAVQNQEFIFDLIGQTGAVESNTASYNNFKLECQPHLNIFKACADLNTKAVLVFCSSRLVYGKPTYLPVDEEHPLSPDSLYAVHKITLENYLSVFSRTSGLRSTVIRLSNPYGPNIEAKDQSYGLINIFIQKALNGEPLVIYGDGSQQRDYIHTRDLCAAFLSAATNPASYGQTFNLGGETSVSIREVAEIISEITHKKPLEFIDWPHDHKLVESGDFATSLRKTNSILDLPQQLPFKESLISLVDQLVASKNRQPWLPEPIRRASHG